MDGCFHLGVAQTAFKIGAIQGENEFASMGEPVEQSINRNETKATSKKSQGQSRSRRSSMLDPILFLLDPDAENLAEVDRVLRRRFGADYRVMAEQSPEAALESLERLKRQGEAVALVAADLRLPGTDGVAFLARAHVLHRHAKRALLIAMDRRGTRIPFDSLDALQRATALGQIDFWVMKGWAAPEELMYPQIQRALSEWTRANRPRHIVVRVIGNSWSPQSHELREALARNTVPYVFYESDSDEGRQFLHDHKIDTNQLPVVISQDGTVLKNVDLVKIAQALGVHTHPSTKVYDLVILGAGPAGLAAAVYAASEGLESLVIEPLAIGGQAGTSSMIRNYLGFPWGISGGELAFLAWEQALLFGAQFVFGQRAKDLTMRGQERIITLTDGSEVIARSVMIASGVEYRRLGIPVLDRLIGAGVFYSAAGVEALAMAGEDVFVIGGANSAGQAALHLAKFAARVTLLVRGDSLEASMSEYLITQLHATPNIVVRFRTQVVGGSGENRLENLLLEDEGTGGREEVTGAAVFVMIGAEPHTEWLRNILQLDDRGYILTGRDISHQAWLLERPPLPFETSIPGVFAVGDARHGSVKRVAGAVGEGSVAVGSIHQYHTLLSQSSSHYP
jgi:thioredoxin reductase (NADPH)